jgi:nucleoside-diphosphate-sugar epimerase
MKKVFVTGASGFIGSHCLPILLEKNYEIHAVSTFPPNDLPKNFIWHKCNLLDSRQASDLLAKIRPTHLLHFAWVTQPGIYWNSLDNFLWVQASLNLLQSFFKNKGHRVVMAGTCAEYDWSFETLSEESTPCSPSTAYGNCKHSLQTLLATFCRETGLSSAWGRIFFLFGPREHPQRLTSFIIRSLLQGKSAPCTEGSQIRDFLHVEDVAQAFVALLESSAQGPVNIGSGEAVTVRNFISKIGEKMDRADLIRPGDIPTGSNDPAKLIADTTKLRNEVGWVPKYDLDQGIDQTIKWWKEHLS